MKPFRSRRVGSALAAAAALVAMLGACSSGGNEPAAANPAAPAAAGGDSKATVEKLLKPVAGYQLPGESLSNVGSLAGRTVYYIPITQQHSAFTVTGNGLRDALAAAGLRLQVCSGDSNPSQISACVNQASGAGAAAIVTDAIPYTLAANAFDAARAKKIPVLITSQVPDPAHPADATLAYIEGGGHSMLTAIADWISADSGGNAKIVFNQSTDSPSAMSYGEDFRQRIAQQCAGCSVVTNQVSTTNFPLVASSTSSAILRTPGVAYLVTEFEAFLQPTLGGAQQSGRMASLKGGSTAATLTGLRMIASKNFLYADVGKSLSYQGWAAGDAVLRLLLGKPVPEYEIPIRLFTRDTISSIPLTSEAEASGEWYGPTDFPAKFRALWGLSG